MRQRTLAAALLLAVLSFAAAPLAAAEPHPFTVQDLLAMQRISEPQASPDGDRVAFVVRTRTWRRTGAGPTCGWSATDGSGLRQLTSHEADDTSPRWAPDGKSVYFLSTRRGSPGLALAARRRRARSR